MISITQKLESLGYQIGPSPIHVVDDGLVKLLPSDYARFLGLFPSTGLFDADVCAEGLEKSPGALDGLYPISMLYGCSDRKSDDLASVRVLDGDTPKHFLEIGRDLFGNRFLLDLRPETSGRIYFHYHDEHLQSGMYLIANNFSDFISSMRHVD
jgi:hypothetical protein